MDIIQFKNHLISDEKSEATVSRYVRDVTTFIFWLNGREMSKELMIQYKAELVDKYEPASVNTMLASLNAYFDFIGHSEYKVRNLKLQKNTYIEPFGCSFGTFREYQRIIYRSFRDYLNLISPHFRACKCSNNAVLRAISGISLIYITMLSAIFVAF